MSTRQKKRSLKKMDTGEVVNIKEKQSLSSHSRRAFLAGIGRAAALSAIGLPPTMLLNGAEAKASEIGPLNAQQRRNSICGFVRDRFNLKSIYGAEIIATSVSNKDESKGESTIVVFGSAVSQNNGFYKIDLPNGIFQLSVQADQYVSNKVLATIDNNDIVQDIMLVNKRKARKIQKYKKVDFDDIYYDDK